MKVSISIVAAIGYDKCLRALQETLRNSPNINHIYWFSDQTISQQLSVPVTWIRIKPFVIGSSFDLWYNYISLKLMPAVVNSDYNIIVQSDGFAVNKSAWTDEFFKYDYIGAVWPHMIPGENVGNGGFSWRSRKLYDALLDWAPSYEGKDWPNLSAPHYHILDDGTLTMPEDALLASPYRRFLEARYGIRYASESLANQWSLETASDSALIGKSFGFHGAPMAQQLGILL